MPGEDKTFIIKNKNRLAPALAALASLDELETKRESVSDSHLVQRLLEDGLGLCDQALRIFRAENEIWPDSWLTLHKAALLTDLAQLVDPAVRQVHTRSAIELIRKAISKVDELPSPNLKLLARIYTSSIDTVLRIRAFYDQPDSIEALDDHIRTLASRLGEIQAFDLSMRSEAYDLLFSAQVLDSTILLEENPDEQKAIRKKSEGMALEAYDRLRLSSTSTLEPLMDFLQQVQKPLPGKPETLLATCPRCGAENNRNASFCNECGATLAHSVVLKDDLPENICRRCSHPNRENALFCTYCGSRLKQEG
ncbi:MAG: zinc ribbon domain-containing protein [Anaerolineales bacterium]|nr:zinc ribbon domain-containing protein [Anaerolineales bacterium]